MPQSDTANRASCPRCCQTLPDDEDGIVITGDLQQTTTDLINRRYPTGDVKMLCRDCYEENPDGRATLARFMR